MSDNIAIKVDRVNKSFKLPHEKVSSIKSAVVNFYKRKRSFEKQEVLKDISFEIKKGEFFGIVGRNGSGKSTLLKLLAGIYTPDSGQIHINGKLTPFIELGVGFSPELTGRENVFLNGALLGFSRKEMEKMYDEIVEFAELERFMDQKLKNYSSGMQVRLAFSIAIQAKTDILVLDEVLAVGDAAFQKKCNKVFTDFKKNGKTVVLVSHDMESVKKFCDKVAVINAGKIQGVYSPSEAATNYQEINAESEKSKQETQSVLRRWGNGKVRISNIKICINGRQSPRNYAIQGKPFEIYISLSSKTKESVVVGLMFSDDCGLNISGPNSKGQELTSNGTAVYVIDKLPLSAGEYKITAAVFNADLTEEYDHIEKGLEIIVKPAEDAEKNPGKVHMFGRWSLKK
jgi:ABC-2 type transport system ATP-binding protein